VLPGDFVGLRDCIFETAVRSVMTLERCVVARFGARELVALMREVPAFGAAMFWDACREQRMPSRRLALLARCSACERIAGLFLELHARLRVVGIADERSFTLPITQSLIADAVGLSAVHVSRSLRRLIDAGLVRLARNTVTLPDPCALAAAAGLDSAPSVGGDPRRELVDSIAGAARVGIDSRIERRRRTWIDAPNRATRQRPAPPS